VTTGYLDDLAYKLITKKGGKEGEGATYPRNCS
jgi:hypothetical protein